jgi:starch synthase
MVLLLHPTGNQNVRHAALAFTRDRLLHELWTSVNWDESSWLNGWMPKAIRRQLSRRSFPQELKSEIRTQPFREVGRQVFNRIGWDFLVRKEHGPFSIEAIYHNLDRNVARSLARSDSAPKAVYAYDDGAFETFRMAKSLGIYRIYEHPITHWRKVRAIQREAAERHPEWECTLGALQDSDEKLARKDEELALANLIIVPSTFSKESLKLAPGITAPIEVIPYGAPTPPVSGEKLPPKSAKLRVLFVGGLTQAKGLGYLLEAANHLKDHIELTLIGKRVHPSMPSDAMIRPWRWIPSLPHDQVLALMNRQDVLVCASLHEGLSLVLLEALSQGLPIIATYNSGAPDIITHGCGGFLIPPMSVDAIVESLETLLTSPELLLEMSAAAKERAIANSWGAYETKLATLVRRYLDKEDIQSATGNSK